MLAVSFYPFSGLCKSHSDDIEDWFVVGSCECVNCCLPRWLDCVFPCKCLNSCLAACMQWICPLTIFGLVNEGLRCLINLVG